MTLVTVTNLSMYTDLDLDQALIDTRPTLSVVSYPLVTLPLVFFNRSVHPISIQYACACMDIRERLLPTHLLQLVTIGSDNLFTSVRSWFRDSVSSPAASASYQQGCVTLLNVARVLINLSKIHAHLHVNVHVHICAFALPAINQDI